MKRQTRGCSATVVLVTLLAHTCGCRVPFSGLDVLAVTPPADDVLRRGAGSCESQGISDGAAAERRYEVTVEGAAGSVPPCH